MQNNVNDQQNNSIEKRKEKRLDKSLVRRLLLPPCKYTHSFIPEDYVSRL